MPYPVQPPKPPAIIENLPPKTPVTPQCREAKCRFSTQTPVSVSNKALETTAIPNQTPPETFAPEPSPLKAAKSAALLGGPVSIGSKIQESAVSSQDQELPTIEGEISGKWENNQQQKTASLGSGEGKIKPPAVTRLLTQERGGAVREFDFQAPTWSEQPLQKQEMAPKQLPAGVPLPTSQPQSPPPQQIPTVVPQIEPQEVPSQNPQPQSPPPPLQIPQVAPPPTPQPQNPPVQPQPSGTGQKTPPVKPITPSGLGGVVELTADRQEYDVNRQIITAEGNVLIRLQNGVVDSDRAQISLPNRVLVAEGNVALRRGQQILRGDRLEYYFAQDHGTVLRASGEIIQARTGTDFNPISPTSVGPATVLSRPLSDRILVDQPLQQVTYPGGYTFLFGSGRNFQYLPTGPAQKNVSVNHFRFQAERVDFDSEGWRATNIRITNDPFSPPELELRADTARFRQLQPLVSELTTTHSRIVFDQGLSLPIFQDRRVIDQRPREPALISFGYDATDRGGFFAQIPYTVFSSPQARLSVTPQYFIQRGIKQGTFLAPSDFGFLGRLDATLSPRTTIRGRTEFLTLDPTDLENKTRASLRLNQVIGTTLPHTLALEYSYRDRLYNGSLGFQTVQQSLGAVISSPPAIPLGKTGISLNYQAGIQYINATTDRLDLLSPNRTNDRINLARYQGVAILSRGFSLWQGQALPATANEGLHYTPVPVVPYLLLSSSVVGVATGYSSGDSQSSLSGNIGLQGQFGHFSRPFLDYTGFNISYSQVVGVGSSPFLFDRQVDNKVLSGGITQQLYGPIRVGFQTSFNLDTGRALSTDYILEYSRRTYDLILRYNPTLAIGSLSLRINDFNWQGSAEPFDGTTVRPVIQGVPR